MISRLRFPGSVRAGALLLGVLLLLVVVGPLVAQYPPNEPHYADKLIAPNAEYWFGTDQYGRDQFSRVMHGLRLSLLSAFLVLAGSATISLLVGLGAGLYGGRLDRAVSRVIDVVLAIPGLVLALAVVGLLGPGYVNLLLALVIASWAADARVARALTLAARTRPYVVAARVAGVSRPAIGVRHLLPAVLGPFLIVATLRLGGIVVALAGLSFLGLGVQMPEAELGAIMGDARRFLTAAPWLLIAPSVAILAMAAAANLLAEGLRDRSDKEWHR
ncbi:ABC transporter permease [Nocardia colli]|uniref:ABC transporter permease n=1 Tax=Nocardia colli TaxID=2545717 RepID=A0A5N0E8B2_9NOCA|nr:ABC transporter permease [Nocardia colli]KAA8885648.1 ABC transporter permease [Nocardia colli]